jgi:hypothetical protein
VRMFALPVLQIHRMPAVRVTTRLQYRARDDAGAVIRGLAGKP